MGRGLGGPHPLEAVSGGVSAEADSGSPGGAGRAAGGAGRGQKFPAQLSLPPSSARARPLLQSREAAVVAAAAAGNARGTGLWVIAVGAGAAGSGHRLPGARPSAGRGARAGGRGGAGTATAK